MVSGVLDSPEVLPEVTRQWSTMVGGRQAAVRLLRELLLRHGYTAESVSERVGQSCFPALKPSRRQLARTESPTALNALVRMFFLGQSLSGTQLNEVFRSDERQVLTGLLDHDPKAGGYRARVSIAISEGLFVTADPVHRRHQANYVPGISRVTQSLSRLLKEAPAQSVLDLGSGQGYLALRAAAAGAKVTASDINPRGHQFLTLSRQLNVLENIQCRTGNYFQPISRHLRFDTIVSNPSFVIGAPALTHYSVGQQDDQMALTLAKKSVGYLRDKGCLLMMFDWLDYANECFETRLARQFEGLDCDTWAIPSYSVSPDRYVELRLKEYSTFTQGTHQSGIHQDWLQSLLSRQVTRIYGGLLVVRKRAGPNWHRVEGICDLAHWQNGRCLQHQCQQFDHLVGLDDAALVMTKPLLTDDAEVVISVDASPSAMAPTIKLRRRHGLIRELTLDNFTHQLISKLDGRGSVADVLAAVIAPNRVSQSVRTAAALAVRALIAYGFLVLDQNPDD